MWIYISCRLDQSVGSLPVDGEIRLMIKWRKEKKFTISQWGVLKGMALRTSVCSELVSDPYSVISGYSIESECKYPYEGFKLLEKEILLQDFLL